MSAVLRIAPSILAADFTQLGAQIAEAEAAGADQIHIDVMDGRFVPNISMGPFIVEAARRATRLPLDVHLMIVEPEKHIRAFANAGADILTVHAETSQHLHRVIQQIRQAGVKPGVALNPHTPAIAIREILSLIDMALVMTVNPGYGGQSFIQTTLSKIQEIREMSRVLDFTLDIQVDGGIDATTAPLVVEHGANVLVAGTAIFQNQSGIAAAINALRRLTTPTLEQQTWSH